MAVGTLGGFPYFPNNKVTSGDVVEFWSRLLLDGQLQLGPGSIGQNLDPKDGFNITSDNHAVEKDFLSHEKIRFHRARLSM
jgi:hypothetical protein